MPIARASGTPPTGAPRVPGRSVSTISWFALGPVPRPTGRSEPAERLIRFWKQQWAMGINRESERAIKRDIEENPELYAALVDDDEVDDAEDE